METKKLWLLGMAVLIAVIVAEGWWIFQERQAREAALMAESEKWVEKDHTHIHVDFKVFITGTVLDFTAAKYQFTKDGQEIDPHVHLHDGNGNVIHIHRQDITLGDFFRSLGIQFDERCLTLDTGEVHCSDGLQTLKFFVNGELNDQFANYEPKDLDRLLVSFGTETDGVLKRQLNLVTDEACIFSEKCPERGVPPEEACATGNEGICN